MSYPRILVVTSCTGEKQFKPSNQLSLKDFKDPDLLSQREDVLASFKCSAASMYTGAQHRRVMEGVSVLRQAIETLVLDVTILSAGYGLIGEDKIIAPYEVTFNRMKSYEIDEWAKFLNIHDDFEGAISNYDLVFILLGENYLRALKLPVHIRNDQTLIFLASRASQNYIQELAGKTYLMPLSNADAQKFGYGLVGLKGFLFKKFAQSAAKDFHLLQKLYDQPESFIQLADNQPDGLTATALKKGAFFVPDSLLNVPETFPAQSRVQLELPIKLPEIPFLFSLKINQKFGRSETDSIIPLPDIQPAANYDLGMKYFIPEWDDHVDPDYNFMHDLRTPNRDPHDDEVYAHQIFSSPNYDGILVSKTVFDKTKKKKAQILKEGIHDFIRFHGLVMGDCGAFGYIKEDTPPYTTKEILEYYQSCGFNYGVSVDHLVVGSFAQPGIREKRYQLTINNAENFIQNYITGDYNFTPIGAVQGWNPESYASAVKAYIDMGYEYIALGGLARAKMIEILEILEAIYPHITPKTKIHLFGVGRLNAIPVFRHLGVTSFDSASPLRKAWLDPAANYHGQDGQIYAAVRIPKVDGSGLRIKRILEAGVADKKTLQLLEHNALSHLRKFDVGRTNLGDTLEAIVAYDELLELPRNGIVNPAEQRRRSSKHAQLYRKLLEDKPWKHCDCPICQKIGIEVVIFRGNDRNRRRGFHNTYVFYKRFKSLLKNAKYTNL
jgi:hypothetical protein